MTSLELIEEEIKRLKDILESDYVLDVPCLRDTKYTTWANDRLQTLQQIKDELEAWMVVKEDIIYQETIPCEERPEYTYEFKNWTFEINEGQYDFEEKSRKLKKALNI